MIVTAIEIEVDSNNKHGLNFRTSFHAFGSQDETRRKAIKSTLKELLSSPKKYSSHTLITIKRIGTYYRHIDSVRYVIDYGTELQIGILSDDNTFKFNDIKYNFVDESETIKYIIRMIESEMKQLTEEAAHAYA
jgi:hypothetical protein